MLNTYLVLFVEPDEVDAFLPEEQVAIVTADDKEEARRMFDKHLSAQGRHLGRVVEVTEIRYDE